jgi:acetyl esterase/lipase
MRWPTLVLAMTTFAAVAGPAFSADEPKPWFTVDVWPAGKVPGEPSGIGEETEQPLKPDEKPVRRVTNVTVPTLTVLPAPPDRATGASVVIAPGGGYNILAFDLEGEEIAAWLNSIGVTGIILKYRVPRREGTPGDKVPDEPLQDAQRALSLVRSHAAEWGLDPARVGVLGFSAGGNLAARAATAFEKRTYDPLDAVDEFSCRPDFGALIYPAYLEQGGELRPEYPVDSRTPPIFFVHAGDDRVRAENSVALFLALRKARVPAELHIYSKGGHGFGLRPSDDACSTWPARCADWMKASGWLSAPK